MILLDTHVLLWVAIEPKKLSKAATQAIRRASRSGGLCIASITLLELAVLFARGHVRSAGTVSQSLAELVDRTSVQVREITPVIAATAAQFGTGAPSDPADRLIMATALEGSIPLVTRDERIREGAVCQTIW